MPCYVVTFEPTVPASAATTTDRLKALGSYCPINASSWAIVTEKTAAQLRDYLSQDNAGARIFVVRSGTEAAWINTYGEKNSEWLKKYL
jgi:hypothetical protein